MSRLFRTIRANILYGIVVLIPVAAFILIAFYLFDIWKRILLPISDQLGLSTVESRFLAAGLALVALLVACFVIGAIVRTRLGSWTFEKIESRILTHLPGYGIISTLLRGFADDRHAYVPAFVTLSAEGVQVLGFIMEDSGGNEVTVFVPSAPMMTVGQVYRVARERIAPFSGSGIDAANCISQWGVGLDAVIEGGKPASAPSDAAKTGPIA